MRLIAPTILLAACTLSYGAEPTDPSVAAPSDGSGIPRPTPTGGQVDADLRSQYDRFLANYGINPLSETLMDDMIKANSKEFDGIERNKAAARTAGTQPGGVETTVSLPGGWATTSITLGGTIRDIGGAAASYQAPPETVEFISKSGPNRLKKLDEKMKRTSNWLNKHTCGGFDFGAQFNFLFKLEVLKEYVKQLGEGVVAAAPMALLGAFSPQLAEAVKHLKVIAGMDLSQVKLDCNQIQGALTGGLVKAGWSTNYAKCMHDNKDTGVTNTVQMCQAQTGSSSWLADPAGQLTQTMNAGAATAGNWVGKQMDRTSDWFGSMFDSSDSSTSANVNRTAAGNAVGAAGHPDATEQAYNEGIALPKSGEQDKYASGVGTGVKSIMKDLFGQVKFSATGGIEVGRKSMNLIDVQFKMHSVTMANKLTQQLDDHYIELTAAVLDAANLQKSYRFLNTWTLRTRGADKGGVPAWNSDPYSKLNKVKTITVYEDGVEVSYDPYLEQIGHRTFDNLAVLRSWMGRYKDNPEKFGEYDTKYGVTKFVTALAKYELLLYVYEVAVKDALNSFLQQGATSSAADNSGGNREVYERMKSVHEAAMKDIETMIGREQEVILTYLPTINRFHIEGLRTPGGGTIGAPVAQPLPRGAELPMGQ